MPDWFLLALVAMVATGVASTVWRVSTARRMARQSGMDEDDATAMALLTDDGIEATYLASSLRDGPAAPRPTGSVADRLGELQGLLDRGLITQEEHDVARRRILDDL